MDIDNEIKNMELIKINRECYFMTLQMENHFKLEQE